MGRSETSSAWLSRHEGRSVLVGVIAGLSGGAAGGGRLHQGHGRADRPLLSRCGVHRDGTMPCSSAAVQGGPGHTEVESGEEELLPDDEGCCVALLQEVGPQRCFLPADGGCPKAFLPCRDGRKRHRLQVLYGKAQRALL